MCTDALCARHAFTAPPRSPKNVRGGGLRDVKSQRTSALCTNRRRLQASSVTDVLTTFWRPLFVIRVQTYPKMKSVCCCCCCFTLTETFDHISWATITSYWTGSKTFKQTFRLLHTRNHDRLNLSTIWKTFTNNIFKTNLYSRRSFWPQNITACQSLHCDLSSITRHYRILNGDTFGQIFHSKFLAF